MQVSDRSEANLSGAFARKMTLRRGLGWAVCIGGSLLLLNRVFYQITSLDDRMFAALVGGGVAALATALGTLPVLFSQKFSQRTYDCFLGFGAGVMLAAAAFSLIVPALAAIKLRGADAMEASVSVGGGIFIGALLILLLDRLAVAKKTMSASDDAIARPLRAAWLFVLAVSLHNLPEGLAIGVAYAGIDLEKAQTLATGISIQDVPEGLVVALALRSVGYNLFMSAGMGVASGLIEPIAAVAGVALISIFAGLLPWGLAAAAGAMLFVICRDVIPESHRDGNRTHASISVMVGFVMMTVLDTALT